MRAAAICSMILWFAWSAGTTSASTATGPSRFALPLSVFPQPALLIRRQVESNVQALADAPVVSGPRTPAEEGRITGYLMEAVQSNVGRFGNPHPVVTAYLVSEYPGADAASRAYGQQRSGWETLVQKSPTGVQASRRSPASWKVGDAGSMSMYNEISPASQGAIDLTELLFRRNSVLVQIWQYCRSADSKSYGDRAAAALSRIAHKLDARAGSSPVTPTAAPKFK